MLLGRKAMTNLDSLLRSRDITLPTKVCIIKAIVFPVVMYACESWTIKKAEHQRTDAFELWCWRRFLRVPWIKPECTQIKPVSLKGNQSCIFIGRTDAEAEAPILWPPDVKTWLTGKDPHAGKDWRQEEMGTTENEIVGWHHRLNGWVLALREMVKNREAWHATVHGVAKSRTWLSDWTTTTKIWKKKEQQQPRREAVAATQSGTWGRWKGECSRADAEEHGGLPPTAKPCGHT